MSRSRRRSKARRFIETLLLLAGLAGIGIFVWSKVSETVYQKQADRAFEQKVEEKQAEPAPPSVPSRVRQNEVVGRLTIPRLHLRDIVREGTGEDTLRVAAGHIEGTALPGQAGNVGIAGHRDTMFRALRNIRKDDLIEFQTVSGSYSYEVDSTTIVSPQDVSVLKAGSAPQLTLVTCYPFYYVGSAPKRFIVKARQVSVNAPPANDVAEAASAPAAEPARTRVRERTGGGSEHATRMVMFQIGKGHSRELAPGISFGLTSADAGGRRVNGWMWLMPDKRTIWLKNQSMREPVVFYSGDDGTRRELRITNVSSEEVNGYLLVYPGRKTVAYVRGSDARRSVD